MKGMPIKIVALVLGLLLCSGAAYAEAVDYKGLKSF